MDEPRTPVPALPGGPDPTQPVPRTPIDGVDLAMYASVAARLAQRAQPRGAVLAASGLDEVRWIAIEKGWLLRIATALLQQDRSLPREYDAAYAVAQASIAASSPLPPLEVYARAIASIEAGHEPAVAIAGAGLTLASFAAAQRVWTARIAADPDLAASFRAMVGEPGRE